MKKLIGKIKGLKKTTKVDFATYGGVILAFLIVSALGRFGFLNRSISGMLVPICAYIVMAVSLNLVVGILGELSLGHAGFMSVGAFTGVIVAQSLQASVPSAPLRLALAIVTLAFGEIIKELINCLLVGYDSKGLHIAFNLDGSLTINDIGMAPDGMAIIKGAQGATGTATIASFTAGFILIMLTLVIVLNLVRSRAGRAIMALRDNRIAAESVGVNVTKYKLMAFVTSAALAGAAGALYGLNYSGLTASKFGFDTSILVLVYVVLGGLGNMWGSIIAATVLYILPEALREFRDYRMLVYAIVLILVMLATNNDQLKGLLGRIIPKRKGAADNG